MSEEIKVKTIPTPIQRNELDVAMELTKLYYESHNIESIEDIQNTFAKFKCSVEIASSLHTDGTLEFVSKELAKAYKIGR